MEDNKLGYDTKLDIKLNILHLFKTSYPSISGYTVRSHFILTKQKSFSNPIGLVDPYFIKKRKLDVIQGNIYYRYPPDLKLRLFNNRNFSHIPFLERISQIVYLTILKTPMSLLRSIVKQKKIDLIHGHTYAIFSNFGEKAAREAKIPFVYEVRGFWEDSRVGVGRLEEFGYQYMKTRRSETKLMKKADAVITLGEMMKKEIISRGLDKKKVFVIPNGVDTQKFKPIPPDIDLKEKLKLKNKKIVAYIGSIQKFEGIDTLIRAIAQVKKEFDNIVLILIGSSFKLYKQELINLSRKLRIKNSVHFIGRIPTTIIKNYYSIVDIIVIPRKNIRVCRLVPPLKQLEAMAMKKVVIASDLPALRENIKPSISGDVFEAGNHKELAQKILKYLYDETLVTNLSKTARNYVQKHHDWNTIIKKYISLYHKLLE